MKILINKDGKPRSYNADAVVLAYRDAKGKIKIEEMYDNDTDSEADCSNALYMIHSVLAGLVGCIRSDD